MKFKTAATMVIGSLLLSGSLIAYADDDGDNRVATVNNKLYAEECGSCHFAYPPGLLPERSWRKLMTGLDDHFGENAELDEIDRQTLENYLASNSGDQSHYKRSKKLMRSIRSSDTPLRITEIPYLKKEHHEVPKDALKNEKVRSLSNCDACHRTAAKGNFDVNGINIPGYGKWDD